MQDSTDNLYIHSLRYSRGYMDVSAWVEKGEQETGKKDMEQEEREKDIEDEREEGRDEEISRLECSRHCISY